MGRNWQKKGVESKWVNLMTRFQSVSVTELDSADKNVVLVHVYVFKPAKLETSYLDIRWEAVYLHLQAL